jgi:hypothetical protein
VVGSCECGDEPSGSGTMELVSYIYCGEKRNGKLHIYSIQTHYLS